MPTYLDNNATTPVAPEVLEAMQPYWADEFGNAGSRTHIFGTMALEAVVKSRILISSLLNAHQNELIFTSGATESNNIAILGLAKNKANLEKKHIITSMIEHKSVLEPLNYLAECGYEVDYAPMDRSGRVNASDIVSRVRPDTLLVSIMHVNNETGVIQPISDICNALADKPVYFHTDAAQGFGKLNKDLKNKRLDLISMSSHKIFGPKGIGALLIRKRSSGIIPISPVMFGGGQEKGLRPGTLPVPLIVGFSKAAELIYREYSRYTDSNRSIKNELIKLLSNVRFNVNGDMNNTIPHVINICVDNVDSEALMIRLKNELAISNGSACTSESYKPSHVLSSMGIIENEILSSIRLSWNYRCIDCSWISKLCDEIKMLQA